MKLDKISLDLGVILDPYKFSIILSGLDKYYSEIFIPESYKILEVLPDWNFGYSFSMQPFTESYSLKEYKEFNFAQNSINANNFIASFQLLQKAEKLGMISFLNSQLDLRMLFNYVGSNEFFSASVNIRADDSSNIEIMPDRGGVLEALFYYDLTENIKPIFGNGDFVSYLDQYNLLENIQTFNSLEKRKEFETFLRCPKGKSVDELFDFIKNLPLIEEFNYTVANQNSIETKKRDLSLLFVEFLATTAIDTTLFAGLPISSGSLLTYKGVERILKGKKPYK